MVDKVQITILFTVTYLGNTGIVLKPICVSVFWYNMDPVFILNRTVNPQSRSMILPYCIRLQIHKLV